MREAKQLVEVVEPVVRRVGERLRSRVVQRETIQVSSKGPADIVTELDLWSEVEIRNTVITAFPESTVIGEETAAELVRASGQSLEALSARGLCVFIDPIDGTTNFASAIPHFAISVGATFDGELLAGIIYDPMRDEMFTATRGGSAFLNGEPIATSQTAALGDAVIATDFPPAQWQRYMQLTSSTLAEVRAQRHFGSAALDLAWVACGRLDGQIISGVKAWDIAAGALLVTRAGGRIGHAAQSATVGFSLFASTFLFAGPIIYRELEPLLASSAN